MYLVYKFGLSYTFLYLAFPFSLPSLPSLPISPSAGILCLLVYCLNGGNKACYASPSFLGQLFCPSPSSLVNCFDPVFLIRDIIWHKPAALLPENHAVTCLWLEFAELLLVGGPVTWVTDRFLIGPESRPWAWHDGEVRNIIRNFSKTILKNILHRLKRDREREVQYGRFSRKPNQDPIFPFYCELLISFDARHVGIWTISYRTSSQPILHLNSSTCRLDKEYMFKYNEKSVYSIIKHTLGCKEGEFGFNGCSCFVWKVMYIVLH